MEKRLEEILHYAIEYNATDIHFSINDETIKIDMRCGENIICIPSVDNDIAFFRYLQYLANLDVGNYLEPQTGHFEYQIDDKNLSLRFAILHSFHLTSGVLRILNNKSNLQIKDLCFDTKTVNYLANTTMKRNGLILFSGPTGSGKTTTLYTLLNGLGDKKVFSLEDPIEVYSKNIVQLQVNEKQHMGYDDGIKQLLRHDPDIIMIGEIRDSKAALMAIRSALTGHLVVSTIHASSCVGAIERMLELGVVRSQLVDVLQGVTNQRLYTLMDGSRKGIYEIMQRKDILYYFETNNLPVQFETLQTKIKQKYQEGIISKNQALQDIDE